METNRLLEQLNYARKRCNELREEMTKATTKMDWRRAEEDLNWWQGKTAWYETELKRHNSL